MHFKPFRILDTGLFASVSQIFLSLFGLRQRYHGPVSPACSGLPATVHSVLSTALFPAGVHMSAAPYLRQAPFEGCVLTGSCLSLNSVE